MEGVNPPQNNEQNRNSTESFFPFSFFRRAPLFGPLIAFTDLNSSIGNNERDRERDRDRERERENIFNDRFPGRANLRIISTTYSNTTRNTELAPQPKINPDEIRETIAQNLLEVQNMIEFGNYNEFNEDNNINNSINKEKYNLNCFDLNKRILAKGQWVDVKDTVEQWLDAQVIEVSEDNKMVKIHYNHWSTRWDEWIEANSPRIMPFRYHTRQSTLTNYHSPFPNKKPDMGVTLLSFEDLNKNTCINPLILSQQRNRSTSQNQTNNNNINYAPPPPSPSSNNINISTRELNSNLNSNNENNNNNNNTMFNNSSTQTENIYTNSNNSIHVNIARRQNNPRYAEPLPPIPSPKHQEPDPENHIVKNLGENGFLGVFKEFDQINKVIEGLSSELLFEHNKNKEILTPKILCDIQNKSYYNLKRLIPILDRTGRIYSDISTFIESSMKNNKLELLSKNLFTNIETTNENLKFFSAEESRRINQDILSHNSRRENRSGTINFVPPVNKFETKFINSIPIIDTPYMIGKHDSPQIFDLFIPNNNDEEIGSSGEDNNNNNNNSNNNNNNNSNSNINGLNLNQNGENNNYIRNNRVESFNINFEGNKNEKITKLKKNKNKNKIIKNGQKIIGNKTKRSKSKKNENENDKEKKVKKKK